MTTRINTGHEEDVRATEQSDADRKYSDAEWAEMEAKRIAATEATLRQIGWIK